MRGQASSDVIEMGKIVKANYLLYCRKHSDYGNLPIEESGLVGILVRILDKVHRALQLSEDGMEAQVTDENLEDTLRDLSNYANMGILELRRPKEVRKAMEKVRRKSMQEYFNRNAPVVD